ncbi:hypothetical protein BJX68DRAFT_107483 [Aspergillus pseudodeflectus]|uniref:Uncharacterized protein n=1 Tax=Aspergillus pseudodeflectus TaxID=176178 RepID=A0ABR4K6U1_9EURO
MMNEHEHHGNNLASFGYLSLTNSRTGILTRPRNQPAYVESQTLPTLPSHLWPRAKEAHHPVLLPNGKPYIFPLCLPLLCPLLSLLLIDTLSLAHVLLPSAGGLGREQAACLHMGPYTMLVPNEMMRGVGST